MDYLKLLNSNIVWIMCGIVMLAVVVQTLIFMKKGWSEATSLGVSKETLQQTVKSSISLSILPTIPSLISLFLLLPLLGIPFPWMRLSVIGSGTFEMVAATMGIEAAGEVLGEALTNKAAVSAMWVMTIGGTAATFVTLCILRPICGAYDKFKNSNMSFVSTIGICSIAGVISCLFMQYCSTTSNSFIIGLSSFIVAFALKVLAMKNVQYKKIADYNLSISLILGMIVAMIIA